MAIFSFSTVKGNDRLQGFKAFQDSKNTKLGNISLAEEIVWMHFSLIEFNCLLWAGGQLVTF